MKTRSGSCATTSQTLTPSVYTYLKPGALAQLRYSKITARSRENGARALRALCQIEPSSEFAIPQPHSSDLAREGTPCFNLRVARFPRCLLRRKLIAVKPYFSQAQSWIFMNCLFFIFVSYLFIIGGDYKPKKKMWFFFPNCHFSFWSLGAVWCNLYEKET